MIPSRHGDQRCDADQLQALFGREMREVQPGRMLCNTAHEEAARGLHADGGDQRTRKWLSIERDDIAEKAHRRKGEANREQERHPYTVALYAESSGADLSSLVFPQTPKALRIAITYEGDLRRRVTIDWRRELIPELDGPAVTQLRGTFAPLQRGDVVLVEYAPTKGTSILVNKGVVVSGVGHDLMLSFLDHWLGQRPLSEEIKRTLLGAP